MDLMTEKALREAGLLEYFDNLPPSHQKEYLKWLSEAKEPETKIRRLAKMIERLRAKQT